MSLLRKILEKTSLLKKIAKEEKISKYKILRDFFKLRKQYQITFDEYYNFEFEKQDQEFRNSYLCSVTKHKLLKILNPRTYYIIARNKYLSYIFLKHLEVPITELYFYYNPTIDRIDNKTANNYKSVVKLLQEKKVKQVVVKTTESFHGEGVIVYKDIIINENDCTLVRYDNSTQNLGDILKATPLIFEHYIEQTSQIKSLNPSSVNTLRFMTSLYPNGEAKLINVFIKIGRGSSCVDNAGSGGNIDAAIDLDTGMIKHTIRFDGFRNTTSITHHPDSNTLIDGICIENWEQIKKTVLGFQKKVPFLKTIGWDIALTDEGPKVIEINDYWDETGQLFLKQGWYHEIKDCHDAWIEYYKVNDIPKQQ